MNLYFRLLLTRLRSRRAGPVGIWETARTRFRVVPTDLDLNGHMNNGRYLTLMDVARLDLIGRSGLWAGVRARGWFSVVASETITFRKSLRLGQAFIIESRVIGFFEQSSYVEQTVLADGEVVARAVVRSRFLKSGGGLVSAGELEELTGPAPSDLQLPDWVVGWTLASRVDRVTAASSK